MTETRMSEIEKTANDILDDIIGASVDLQMAVLHHPAVQTQGNRELIYYKLKAISELAGSLKRREKREKLDPLEATRLKLTNNINSLSTMLHRDHLRGGLVNVSDGELLVLAAMAETVATKVHFYVTLKEAGNAGPTA